MFKSIIPSLLLILVFQQAMAQTEKTPHTRSIIEMEDSILLNPLQSMQDSQYTKAVTWAFELQKRIQEKKYTPTPEEAIRYKSIYDQITNKRQQLLQDDYHWAEELSSKTKSGYIPTEQESVKYSEVLKKSQILEQKSMLSNYIKVSQEEINWALDLENKVVKGFQPTQQDIAKYNDIATRLQQTK